MAKDTRQKQTATQPLEWNVAQNLLKKLQRDKDHQSLLLFAIGFYSGLRIGDILQIKWKQLLEPELKVKEQKTGKLRRIYLNLELRQFIESCYDERINIDSYVFISLNNRGSKVKPISVDAAIKRVKAIFQKYKIKTENASSHTLRKTFALRVYNSLGRTEDALVTLSEILNHSTLKQTRAYIGITVKKINNVYKNLHITD